MDLHSSSDSTAIFINIRHHAFFGPWRKILSMGCIEGLILSCSKIPTRMFLDPNPLLQRIFFIAFNDPVHFFIDVPIYSRELESNKAIKKLRLWPDCFGFIIGSIGPGPTK